MRFPTLAAVRLLIIFLFSELGDEGMIGLTLILLGKGPGDDGD
jgi:hypothetical protein